MAIGAIWGEIWNEAIWNTAIWAQEASEDDTVPDAFSFTDQSGVALSSTITSAAITVTGIDAAATITVTGGEYDINGSGTFTADPGTVNNGDTVRARGTSSDQYLTGVDVAVTIGGVSDTFTITTRAEPADEGGGINAQPRLGGMMIFG
jgi:hypothetical protein